MIRRRRPPHSNIILPAACVFAFTTLAGFASAAEVSATRLDGTTVAGELREWSENEVRLASPAGDQTIATNQLVSLRWPQPATAPAPDKNSGLVELVDGSILPIKTIRADQSRATLVLDGPVGSGETSLTLPAVQIASVRFRLLDPPLIKQWEEMLHLNLANDLIAVLKKDGKSLDYVEGVIGQILPDKIEFKLDGDTQRVDRTKIAGVIYYRPDRRMKEEPRATIQGRSGLRISATHFALKDSRLQITAATGAKFSWPLDDISLADFSAGKLMYLSDIEPASQNWTPLVGLPPAATIAAEYGQPRRDKSAYGGPLALLMREDESPSAQAATKSFNKGLSLRSRTEIVYRLPVGFQRFTALAGIDPVTSASGNVRLVISADDRVLLDTEIAGDQPPHSIQLDISNAKRLKIAVHYGQNLDTGDWLNLCDARIVK